MGEWIAGSFIVALVGAMIWGDMRMERQAKEWWDYDQTHRHCVRRPYKIPRR